MILHGRTGPLLIATALALVGGAAPAAAQAPDSSSAPATAVPAPLSAPLDGATEALPGLVGTLDPVLNPAHPPSEWDGGEGLPAVPTLPLVPSEPEAVDPSVPAEPPTTGDPGTEVRGGENGGGDTTGSTGGGGGSVANEDGIGGRDQPRGSEKPSAPGVAPAGAGTSPAPAAPAGSGTPPSGLATNPGSESGIVHLPDVPYAGQRGPIERFVGVIPWPIDVALAVLALLVVVLAARSIRFRKRLAEAEHLAMTDGLTGLPNRQDAERFLERLVAGSTRSRRPLSIVLIDLDHFKGINDDFGHAAGDATLRGVANALRSQLRAADHVGRVGGEEFLAILPDTDFEEAMGVAERIRERIAAMPRRVDRQVTASLGVAAMPTDATELSELLGAADRALYAAKEAGRDQVVWAGALDSAPDRTPIPA